MMINVGKNELMILVKSSIPNSETIKNPIISKCGKLNDGFIKQWVWFGNELGKLSEKQLFDIYNQCSKSRSENNGWNRSR
jgi:hypothetical protein